jgi:sarcosine oxidase
MRFDAIVLGLGGMGSAALDELTARGLRVLGIDRYEPPHVYGSTHGKSRIIRLAYMEDPAYVPLLRRAYERWGDLEASTGRDLLSITGGLMIGPPDSTAVHGSQASAAEHGLLHEMLDAPAIRRRFPQFHVPDDYLALYEEVAGVLCPEACIETYLARAQSGGAQVRMNTVVDDWEVDDEFVRVFAEGQEHLARHLVVTAGAWSGDLLPGFEGSLQPARQIMHWFDPVGGTAPFAPGRFPVFVWEPPEGDVFYGFPALDGPDGGVKVAVHHGGEAVTPDDVDREVHPQDVTRIRDCIRDRIPALDGRWLEGAVCMYTNTPDLHFALGTHPRFENVHLAAGLSGHGFKFASVIGEVLADLVQRGATPLPIGPFSPARLL